MTEPTHGNYLPALRFKALTPLFDAFCRWIGLGTSLRDFEMSLLEGREPRRILDVGCGTGELLARLGPKFPAAELVGLDPDPKVLGLAEKKLARQQTHARLVEAMADTIPVPDGHFDLIVSSLMFHHLKTDQKKAALREWGRVLAPSGVLLLIDLARPDKVWLQALCWPLRFNITEESGDNFKGALPRMLSEAGFAAVEVGRYRSVVAAYCARKIAQD